MSWLDRQGEAKQGRVGVLCPRDLLVLKLQIKSEPAREQDKIKSLIMIKWFKKKPSVRGSFPLQPALLQSKRVEGDRGAAVP